MWLESLGLVGRPAKTCLNETNINAAFLARLNRPIGIRHNSEVKNNVCFLELSATTVASVRTGNSDVSAVAAPFPNDAVVTNNRRRASEPRRWTRAASFNDLLLATGWARWMTAALYSVDAAEVAFQMYESHMANRTFGKWLCCGGHGEANTPNAIYAAFCMPFRKSLRHRPGFGFLQRFHRVSVWQRLPSLLRGLRDREDCQSGQHTYSPQRVP